MFQDIKWSFILKTIFSKWFMWLQNNLPYILSVTLKIFRTHSL